MRGQMPKGRRGLWYLGNCYTIVNCYFYSHFGGANSILLYNKTLNKHVTARYYLYLGNVENLVNHFRNAPVGGHTCLTAGEQGEPADWGLQLCISIGLLSSCLGGRAKDLRRGYIEDPQRPDKLKQFVAYPGAVGPPTGTDRFIRS